MKNLAVEIKQLTVQFGDQEPLFSNLSLVMEKGEFVAIIGPNGSGKSTLMKTVMGLIKPVSGYVNVYEQKIGYVPQYVNKEEFSPMTVRELLAIKTPGSRFWWGIKQDDQTFLEILKLTNVQDVLDRQIRQLSGGQFQRVLIASALIGNPGLLILDEPVSGIDIHGEQEFFTLLEQLQKKRDLTIVMISHDIDVVYRYASQVVCLNRALICHGEPLEVLTKETIEKTFSSKRGIYHHQHKVDPKHKHDL